MAIKCRRQELLISFIFLVEIGRAELVDSAFIAFIQTSPMLVHTIEGASAE